jgi:hypothetical protein
MKVDQMSPVKAARRPGLAGRLGLLALAGLLVLAAGPRAQGGPWDFGKPTAGAENPAGKARLLEMKVHLAWLSDRLTCRYPLQARCTAEMLEVHGKVPSLRSRQRALELAQEQTSKTILDDVEIVPELEAPRRCNASADLSSAARRLLAGRAAGKVADLRVWAEGDGQITVCGTVRSLEEKLAISLALRELAGCRCVCNRLQISPVARQGRQVTQVTADGRYYLIRPASAPAGASPFRPLPSASHAQAEQKPGDLLLTEATTETAEAGADPSSAPLSGNPKTASAANSGLQPIAATPGLLDPLAEGAAWDIRANPGGLSRRPSPASPNYLPAGLGGPVARATVEKRVMPKLLPTPQPQPQPPQAQPQPRKAPTVSTSRPAGRPARVWPPAHDVRPCSTAEASAQLQPPAAGTTMTRTTSAKPVEPGNPGVIAQDSPVAAGGSSATDARLLKQRVDQVCGRFARYVQILEQPHRPLVLRIEVPSDGLEKLLLGRILSIPEVASNQIHLQSVVRPETIAGPGARR